LQCGTEKKILRKLSSSTKGRSRHGGQSAQRFERIRDHSEHEYVKKICQAMEDSFTTVTEGDGLWCDCC
jgi:peptide chain release factor subunit 1